MFVKFENKHARIFQLKRGVIVEYSGDYYHIQHVYKDIGGNLKLTIVGAFETIDVWPEQVVWLE